MRRITLAMTWATAVLASIGISADASAAHTRSSSQRLKINVYSASLSTGEYALKAVSSLDGAGAGISRVTASTNTFPDIGASSVTIYYRDGVSKQLISWKQLAPNSSGISKFTGHGKCAGGTGIHKKEKCNYTFTGTYNGKTTWNDIRLTGTDTR